jgi:hypothetical protein
MYNQQSRKREEMRYQIIAAEACEPLAQRMEEVGLEFVLIWALIGLTEKTSPSFRISNIEIPRQVYFPSHRVEEIP